MEIGRYNEEKRIENKQEMIKIEKEYSIEKVEEKLLERRKELEGKLKEIAERENVNPILIERYFFQSINPLVNVEPEYSSEKVGIMWQIYEEMVARINEYAMYIPTISSFCNFIGIRVSTLKKWKCSADENMRIVVEKIEDSCYNANVMMSQVGALKERTTVYRMKSEQERIEKETPEIHVHNEVGLDLNAISKRINEIKELENKKAIEGEYVVKEKVRRNKRSDR